MIKEIKFIRLLMGSIAILMVCCFLPTRSQAAISSTGYDFGEVVVGTSQTTQVNITNLDEEFSTTISGFDFDATTCSDYSIGNVPENLTIAPKASLSVEIVYTPTLLGPCSCILKIPISFFSPGENQLTLTFSGTGIEPPPEQPQSLDTSNNPLDQITAAITFMNSEIEAGSLKGTGKGKSAEERLKSFKNMMVTAAHMIENGNFAAAREKLITIRRKTDGAPEPPDFVQGDEGDEGDAAKALAEQIQALIDNLEPI